MKRFLWSVWLVLAIPFSRRKRVKDEPEVQEAQAWYSNEFKPRAGVDYGIALKYAEESYKEVRDVFAALDKKAEWLYGLAIAAIAAVYLMSPDKRLWSLITWGLPSLFLSGLALVSIIRTRMPGDRPAGMSIRGALQCVESTENPIAIISANLHCAVCELAKVNSWKATQIVNASLTLLLAFGLAPLVLLAPDSVKTTPAPGRNPLEMSASQGARRAATEPADSKPVELEAWLVLNAGKGRKLPVDQCHPLTLKHSSRLGGAE
jgi:hypothetical protein